MKSLYIIILTVLISQFSLAQSVSFEIKEHENNLFSILAHISPNMPEDMQVSDIGFAITLPNEAAEIKTMSSFEGRTWSQFKIGASTMKTLSNNSHSENIVFFNLTLGKQVPLVINGQPVEILRFEIDNLAVNKAPILIDNTDAVAEFFGHTIDSFFNAVKMDERVLKVKDYFLARETQEQMNLETVEGFRLYPNPAKDIISIGGDLDTVHKITIYTSTGQFVREVKSDFERLDLSDLDPGAYFMQIHKLSGDFVETKTLLKN